MVNQESRQIAGVVLQNEEGRFLMVQEGLPKAYGQWSIPGGHVDPGETLQQAAIREAKEEVGLDIELVQLEPIHEDRKADGSRVYYGFLGKVVGGHLTPQADELLDARWLDESEINELNEQGKIRSPWIFEAIQKVENENLRH